MIRNRFTLAAALILVPGSISGQTLPPRAHQQLARDIFQELIEINTVGDSGATPAAEALARRLSTWWRLGEKTGRSSRSSSLSDHRRPHRRRGGR